MEAMVENGEEWLEPLLDFRNQLASLQDSSIWSSIRRYKRRDGKVRSKEGVPQPWGPYTFETRKNLLRQLLKTQAAMNQISGRSNALIRHDELEAIRTLWRQEEQDWSDSVPAIYSEVLGTRPGWTEYDAHLFTGEDKKLLEDICSKHDVEAAMVSKLIDVERSLQGMARRSTIQRKLSAVLEEDWRSDDDLMELQERDAACS
jgi:DNA sulfur modification protein DndC